jgi:zinc protease
MRTTYYGCAVASGILICGFTNISCSPLRMHAPAAPDRNSNLNVPLVVLDTGNQAKVLVLPDPAADLITMTVRYGVGSVDDPRLQDGIAHLAEHIMFEMRLGNDRMGDLFERATVYVNAQTSMDTTDYVSTFERDQLNNVLQLEARRLALRCNTLTDDDFIRAKTVVASELKQRASVQRALYLNTMQAIFPKGHPYTRDIGGTLASVGALTKEQTCHFINDHYAPNNATIAIAGPVTSESATAAIKDFALLPAHNVVPHITVKNAADPGPSRSIDAPLQNPGIVLVWALPQGIEERAMSLAVGRITAQKIRYGLLDINADVSSAIFGGAKSEFFAIIVEGIGTKNDELQKRAKRALDDPAAFFKSYGFENASAGELTNRLRQYDDISQRVEIALDSDDRGVPAPVVLQRELLAFGALTREFADKLAKNQFAWSEAQIISMIPDPNADKKLRNTGLAAIAEIHAEPTVTLSSPAIADTALALPPRTNRLGVIHERALPNGLTVLTAPNSNVPIIDIMLLFSTGAALEPRDQRGIAELTAENLDASDHDDQNSLLFYRAGGTRYSTTQDDYIAFHVTGASAYLDILLQYMEQWVATGIIDNKDVERQVASWQKTLTDTQRTDQADISLRYEAMYGKDHPYVKSGLSSFYDFKKLTADNARAFAKRTFVPNRASLIVTGNFNEASVDDWIAYSFYRWRGVASTEGLPQRETSAKAFASSTTANQVTLFIAYPATESKSTASAAEHQIIGYMLDQAAIAIREELAASYGIDGNFHNDAAGGSYVVTGTVEPLRAAEATALLRTRIAALGDGSDTSKRTFAAARRRAAVAASGDPTSSQDLSSTLIHAAIYGGKDRAAELPSAIAKTTYKDIVPALAAELNAKQEIISMSGPENAIKEAFAAIKVTPVWR